MEHPQTAPFVHGSFLAAEVTYEVTAQSSCQFARITSTQVARPTNTLAAAVAHLLPCIARYLPKEPNRFERRQTAQNTQSR